MNKTELQQRIEKLEAELSTVKADLAKCDCAEGIEQEKCWHAKDVNGNLDSAIPRTLFDCKESFPSGRPAYMPECRAVTAEDARQWEDAWKRAGTWEDMVCDLHKLGFRIKVSP